jgi:hypothetical protein
VAAQLDSWARALGGEASGNSVMAPGPGHSPHDRSLSVTLDANAPGGFLVHSFAGDDPIACKDHVRARLGLPAFQPQAKMRKRERAQQPKKTYFDYHAESGAVVYQVERTDYYDGRKKTFRQRRPDGNGGWLWNLGGVQPVPYRLPELIEAAGNGNLIVIAEGEGKVDLLRSWNFAATCNPGGAKNWKAEHSAYLRGADVVVMPDNDDAGRRHLDTVAESLIEAGAASVRVLDLPGLGTKQDIVDWAAAGGIAEALRDLIEHTAKPWIQKNTRSDEGGFGSFGSSSKGHIDKNFWPEPKSIESSLPPVSKFEPELLPEALRDYVIDVADRQQAPPDFAAVAALCGLASLVGSTVRVRPKQHDDWEVVPNLWGAIIGRPSAMKSPAMRSALAPVYALQDSLKREWESALREVEIEGTLKNLKAKDAKRRAANALKDDDGVEAKRLLAEHSVDEKKAPCPRLIVNDATVEKLGELMNENPRGLLLIRDELPGFLARMESEEFQSERAFYLEAHNGDGKFTYDRIGRGTVHIENCTLSIIGGVQPARIAPLVQGAMTGESDDGLIQRLQLTVWPDDLGSWTWTDRRPNASARERYEAAFRDLHDFARNLDTPAIFGFSSQAQEMFREWMTEIQTEARSGNLSSMLESHLLKMPKTVASLALLFHLVDGGRDAIGSDATARALDWADYLRSRQAALFRRRRHG